MALVGHFPGGGGVKLETVTVTGSLYQASLLTSWFEGIDGVNNTVFIRSDGGASGGNCVVAVLSSGEVTRFITRSGSSLHPVDAWQSAADITGKSGDEFYRFDFFE